MHEATIAQSILNIASSKLKGTPNAESVVEIHIIVGEFRNVDIESLEFAFDQLKSLNPGCGACRLKADVVSSRAVCLKGDHVYHPEFERVFRCEICGDGIGKLLSGEELDVVGVTLLSNLRENQQENARNSR